jgi:hypothetical protein
LATSNKRPALQIHDAANLDGLQLVIEHRAIERVLGACGHTDRQRADLAELIFRAEVSAAKPHTAW